MFMPGRAVFSNPKIDAAKIMRLSVQKARLMGFGYGNIFLKTAPERDMVEVTLPIQQCRLRVNADVFSKKMLGSGESLAVFKDVERVVDAYLC